MQEEKPLLFTDTFDEGVIAGNKKGLIELKNTLEKALDNFDAPTKYDVKDSDISAIIYTSSERLNSEGVQNSVSQLI